jgi:hypothetical protein
VPGDSSGLDELDMHPPARRNTRRPNLGALGWRRGMGASFTGLAVACNRCGIFPGPALIPTEA